MDNRNKTHTPEEIASMLSKETIIRPINPDAQLMRQMAVSRAKSNPEFNRVGCTHPVHALHQMVDAPGINASVKDEVPVNVFVCRICNETLWLVDGSGTAAADR